MTVLSAEVSRLGTEGSISRTGERRYVVNYNVRTDNAQDGVIAITEYFRVTPGLPFYGDSYNFFGEQDLNSFLERIVPRKKDGSQFEWEVRCEYQERDPRQNEAGDPVGDPLQQMRMFRFYFNPRQVPVEDASWGGICRKDSGNKTVIFPDRGAFGNKTLGDFLQPMNAAGDYTEILVDQSDMVFTCNINLDSFNADLAQDTIDKLNDSNIQLNLLGTIYNTHLKIYKWGCQCLGYNAQFMGETWTDNAGVSQTTYYWEHEFVFLIRKGLTFGNDIPLGHRVWVPNAGYNRSARFGDPDGKGGTIGAAAPAGRSITQRILDADDLPVSEPTNLDPDGQPLADNVNAYSVEHSVIRLEDFTAIPGVGFTPWTP